MPLSYNERSPASDANPFFCHHVYVTGTAVSSSQMAVQVLATAEESQTERYHHQAMEGDTRITAYNSSIDGGESSRGIGFQTVTRLRGGECGASDCRVLITGCGRSGTHFLAEQLASAGEPEDHYGTTAVLRALLAFVILDDDPYGTVVEWCEGRPGMRSGQVVVLPKIFRTAYVNSPSLCLCRHILVWLVVSFRKTFTHQSNVSPARVTGKISQWLSCVHYHPPPTPKQ